MTKKEREQIIKAFERLSWQKRDVAIYFVIGWLGDSKGCDEFFKALKKYTENESVQIHRAQHGQNGDGNGQEHGGG